MRKIKRQMAKARLKAMGVGNVNRKMCREKDGVKNWRRALNDRQAEIALFRAGARIAKPKKPKRKLWKVSA